MKEFLKGWKSHRALIGYLFLLTVTIIVAQVVSDSVRRDLKRHDLRGCQARQILAKNQRDVIESVIVDRQQHGDTSVVAVLQKDLDQLNRALPLNC